MAGLGAACSRPAGPLGDAIVRYASQNSPYYASLLEGVERFEDIPSLTKPVAPANFDHILVPDLHPERLLRAWTSGSTGAPVAFVTDAWAGPACEAARARLLDLAGIPRGVHVVLVLTDPTLPPGLTGWTGFPMRGTVRDNLRERLSTLDRLGDYILYGIASALEWIATQLERDARPLPMPAPVAVVTTADTLTLTGRGRIERAFGCPVHSWYGSTETDPSLAGTLPGDHDRYVLNEDRAYVEVADEDGRPCAPGERGQVLITDLHSRCFPLLRYAVGDLAVMSERGYGASRVLERLDGRRSTIVELANGSLITESNLHLVLIRDPRAIECVEALQGVQTGPMSLELSVVWRDRRDDRTARAIQGRAKDLWGDDLDVELRDVERLELLPSGKRWLLRRLEPVARPS